MRSSHRAAFVVALVVALVIALVVGNRSEPSAAKPVAPAARADDAAVWFCPGPIASLQKSAGRVTFANFGATAATVAVTDLGDDGKTTQRSLQVPANSTLTSARSDLGAPGALTVETFGGRVVVEEGFEGGGDIESTPCATQAATHAYFAAGTTVRGVKYALVIENPYAADAKVNVTLRTSDGVRNPDDLQSLDITRRSRSVIAIDNYAVRTDRVAVSVDATIGSIVASQTIVYTNAAGAPGTSYAIGANASAERWTFAGGTTAKGASYVAVAATGDDDVQVDVDAHSGVNNLFAPVTLNVDAGTVAWVKLGNCPARPTSCISVPANTPYAVGVRSEPGSPVFVQLQGRFDGSDGVSGAIAPEGAIAPASTWLFAHARVTAEQSTRLYVHNPSAQAAHVSVAFFHDRVVDRPAPLRVTVAAGGVAALTIIDSTKGPKRDVAMQLQSDVPVYAERTIVATDGVSRSFGAAAG